MNNAGWFGIGFHNQILNLSYSHMQDADIWTGVYTKATNGTYEIGVQDRYFNPDNPTPNGKPAEDTGQGGVCVDNVIPGSVSGETQAKYSVFRFARLLDTNDTACDHVIAPGLTPIIYAYGISYKFGFHYQANWSYVDFFPSSPTSGSGTSSGGSGTTSTSINLSTGVLTTNFRSTTGVVNLITNTKTSNQIIMTKNVKVATAVGVIAGILAISNLIAALVYMKLRKTKHVNVVIIDENSSLLSEGGSQKSVNSKDKDF